ncbi:MAG: oligosaccharide flippase family protein [Eubacterium sp.]|nr:oligosaccharide flippase family protein [Eubacterium sp.]
MLKAIRNILGKTNNVTRSSYLWNSINAVLNAAQSTVILMVIMRTGGLRDSGVFSIAYAVATLLMFVGQYGLRRFQSSDIDEKYSFGEYYGIRIITCIVMILASLAYCVYGSIFKAYGMEKFLVIMLVCLVKTVQAFSDVFHGRMQQMGRLDIATRSSSARYVAETGVFCLVMFVTNDLLAASIAYLAAAVIGFLLTTFNAAVDFCDFHPSFKGDKMKQLLIEGFPLFVSLFLNMYLCNAPKYAIDAYLTEEIQAIYNLIFMPAFVVQMVAHFIFNPILTSYAIVWNDRDIRKFTRLVLRQMLLVLGLTILGLAVAATIGIPVLSWLFNADLSGYTPDLCIVMLGGGMLAYATFFNTVITIIRMHRTLLFTYGAAALAAFGLSGYFVVNYGMRGATVLFAVVMTILAVMLGIILFVKLRKERKNL